MSTQACMLHDHKSTGFSDPLYTHDEANAIHESLRHEPRVLSLRGGMQYAANENHYAYDSYIPVRPVNYRPPRRRDTQQYRNYEQPQQMYANQSQAYEQISHPNQNYARHPGHSQGYPPRYSNTSYAEQPRHQGHQESGFLPQIRAAYPRPQPLMPPSNRAHYPAYGFDEHQIQAQYSNKMYGALITIICRRSSSNDQ
jgi:hypothetical protein